MSSIYKGHVVYNFKELTGSTKFLSYKDWPVNQYVVGTVKKFSPNKLNPNAQDVMVEVLDTNISTEKLTLKKGDNFTINGTTALEKVLGEVEEGDILKVTYEGKGVNTTGKYKGKESNRLKIQVAPAQDKANFTDKSEESEDLI